MSLVIFLNFFSHDRGKPEDRSLNNCYCSLFSCKIFHFSIFFFSGLLKNPIWRENANYNTIIYFNVGNR
ncbi:hypothetical protein I79_008767 [Cricetulus griseus]|uniref:Uncharacterized protein n=1 Tax=Cricetulus griseus TaxID=10029 RepID=G3HDZ8_CRIGR|nr:hypothetical protein I79_008767 [Cricetulus griseus]